MVEALAQTLLANTTLQTPGT